MQNFEGYVQRFSCSEHPVSAQLSSFVVFFDGPGSQIKKKNLMTVYIFPFRDLGQNDIAFIEDGALSVMTTLSTL